MASLRTRRVSGSILLAPGVPVVEHYPGAATAEIWPIVLRTASLVR